MITYAISLEKGGVGKTALAVNLASAFHQVGLEVLLIDLDSQASATHWLGVDPATLSPDRSGLGVFNEAINGRATEQSFAGRAIKSADGVYILPAHPQMAGLPSQLSAAPMNGLFLLSELITQLDQNGSYDVIIMDLPPARGPILAMALAAATRCIAPVQPEDLVIRALAALMTSVQQIRSRVNKHLTTSIIRNKYNPRSGADKVFDDLLREEYGEQLLKTIIPTRAALRDSVAARQSVFRYTGPDSGEVRNLLLGIVEELIQLDGQTAP